MDLFSFVSYGGTSWRDLPAELWYEVMKFLNLYDQIRFLSVSNKQLSLLHIQRNNRINRLPWIFELDEISESSSFTYKLFDPIHEYPYQILRIQKTRPDHIYSKHGWLFCLKEKPGEECCTLVTEVFLFCPYTREIIQLPDLSSIALKEVKLRCCFSNSNPKSERCEFFVVYCYSMVQWHSNFVIHSCKRNSKIWRTCCHFTIGSAAEILLIRGFEYFEGKLYLLLRIGYPFSRAGGSRVFVFNYGGNNHEFFRVSKSVFNFDYQLFSFFPLERGPLGIIFTDVSLIKKYIDDHDDDKDGALHREFARRSRKLLTLKNIGTKKFEKKKLENCALFLGTGTSGDSPFLVEDLTEEELGDLGNKIFYIEEDGVKFFDFCKCDFGIQAKYFPLQRDEEEEGARKYRERAWIEPPNRVKF